MHIDPIRRIILKGTLIAGAVGAAIITGLAPKIALAAWPRKAFHATGVPEALKALTGSETLTLNEDAVRIEAPDVAEGGKARIKVFSDLPNIESIAILIPDNPVPLVASFKLGPDIKGYVATRIRMDTTGEVLAVVQTSDKLFSAKKRVIVTPGSE